MGVELSRCQTTSVSKTQASPFQLLVGRHLTGVIPHTTYHEDHRDLKWSLIHMWPPMCDGRTMPSWRETTSVEACGKYCW